MKKGNTEGRKRKEKRTWRQLFVQEILRLGDTDNPLPLGEQNAPEMLARIERFADMGWFEAFPGSRLEKRSDLSALEQLRGLVTEARTFLRSFQNDESYDPEPIIVTVEQRADKAKRGWERVRYISVEDDPLKVKVRTALVEAIAKEPGMKFLRCPICGLLAIVIRRGQKTCSSQCSRIAFDRKRNAQEERKKYLARARFAKTRGVPIEMVEAEKISGRWRAFKKEQ
jgi:predicted nucleic acid-binding Zn ribbon protein